MTEATDIWKAIEERRAHFEAIIEKANATIESARDVGGDLGFASDEVASAVDNAIKAATQEEVHG